MSLKRRNWPATHQWPWCRPLAGANCWWTPSASTSSAGSSRRGPPGPEPRAGRAKNWPWLKRIIVLFIRTLKSLFFHRFKIVVFFAISCKLMFFSSLEIAILSCIVGDYFIEYLFFQPLERKFQFTRPSSGLAPIPFVWRSYNPN